MKKELEEWKRNNGNVTYTTKELIQGIHIKIDRLDKKFSERVLICQGKFVSRGTFWSVISLLSAGVVAAFSAIINFFKG